MLKFNKPTLVTITAPTCSGKSTLLNALVERGCGRIVSTTTRPKREGEIDGIDYRFITVDESKELEVAGAFFELIEFRGVRYGVTRGDMEGQMRGEFAPVVIVEPKGLAIYEQQCRELGWKVYKIYVSTTESERIRRLNARTCEDLTGLLLDATYGSRHTDVFNSVRKDTLAGQIPKMITTHTDRLLSITGEERRWSNTNIWDAIVPGDNIVKALESLSIGVAWRNRLSEEPVPWYPI